MYIYTFLILALCFCLYKDNYPNTYEKMFNKIVVNYNKVCFGIEKRVIAVSYNCIYMFSLCQIKYKKICDIFLKANKFERQTVLFFLDNCKNCEDCIYIELDINSINNTDLIQNTYNYDAILLIDKLEEGKPSNYIFYSSIPKSFEYIVSNVNFLSIEMEYDNKSYKIVLKNDIWNYYIVGNVLNHNFFKYYLNTKLDVKVDETNFEYKINIIDHNVNFVTITERQYIVFGETDYQILANELSENPPKENSENPPKEISKNPPKENSDNPPKENSENPPNNEPNEIDDFINLDSDNLLYA